MGRQARGAQVSPLGIRIPGAQTQVISPGRVGQWVPMRRCLWGHRGGAGLSPKTSLFSVQFQSAEGALPQGSRRRRGPAVGHQEALRAVTPRSLGLEGRGPGHWSSRHCGCGAFCVRTTS